MDSSYNPKLRRLKLLRELVDEKLTPDAYYGGAVEYATENASRTSRALGELIEMLYVKGILERKDLKNFIDYDADFSTDTTNADLLEIDECET